MLEDWDTFSPAPERITHFLFYKDILLERFFFRRVHRFWIISFLWTV
jgi:hypothetical protein